MTTPATYHTPAGWAERCTMRDDKAEHQIRIFHSDHLLYVTCTCRVTNGDGGHGSTYMPMTFITTAEEALTAWRAWHHLHHQEIS